MTIRSARFQIREIVTNRIVRQGWGNSGPENPCYQPGFVTSPERPTKNHHFADSFVTNRIG